MVSKRSNTIFKTGGKLLFFLLLPLSANVEAQIYDPVDSSTSVEKISETEFELVATAQIKPGWHLYP
jgi:thiol:disulfide interchange protein DsbD